MNLSVRRNRRIGSGKTATPSRCPRAHILLSARMRPIVSCIVFAAVAVVAFGWGNTAHDMICDDAASILPPQIKGFFQANSASLRLLAEEPDAISVIDSSTAANHFLDLDAFSKPPFADVPSDEKAFVAKFGRDALKEGKLPWAVRDEYNSLVDSFKKSDADAALRHAGHLAHLVSDATMPLHATKNYKGQFTGNVIFDRPEDPARHVHLRFEIGMIDANRADIEKSVKPLVGKPHLVKDPAAETLGLLKESFDYITPVLDADKSLLKPGDEVRPEYFAELYRRVGDVAARRMAVAATEVASFWQSAWDEAGRPGLPNSRITLKNPPLTLDEARKMRDAQLRQEPPK